MDEDAVRLSARITGEVADWIFERGRPWQVNGETYRLAGDEQYQDLGEEICGDEAPLILARESDGQCFEVQVEATAWPTDRLSREQERQRLARMRETEDRMAAQGAGEQS